MASVETELGAKQAQKGGWRTFRIIAPDAPLSDNEILCRHTEDDRNKCETCLLCDGSSSKPNIYGDRSIGIVTNNPYQLATDIYGIGFITADKIARNLGVPTDSEFRYRAGITHVLNEASEDGHCYLPQAELIEKVSQCLKTDDHQPSEDNIAAIVKNMSLADELIRENSPDKGLLCYNPAFFNTEQNLALLIAQRLRSPINPDINRVRTWLSRFTESRKVQLSEQQQVALFFAIANRQVGATSTRDSINQRL